MAARWGPAGRFPSSPTMSATATSPKLDHVADRFHGAEEVDTALGAGWDIGYAGVVEGRRPDGSDVPGVNVLVRARRR